MSNMDIRYSLQAQTKVMKTQAQVVTNYVVAQVNLGNGPQPNASTPVSRTRDFMRMNPFTFNGTNVDTRLRR